MIVAANWKMNLELSAATTLASEYCAVSPSEVTRILFAPHPYLMPIGDLLKDSDNCS